MLSAEPRDAARTIASVAGRTDRSFVVCAATAGAGGDSKRGASDKAGVSALGDSVGDSPEGNSGAGASTGSATTVDWAATGDDCAGAAVVSAIPLLSWLALATRASRAGSVCDGGSIPVNVFAGVSVSADTGVDANVTCSRPVLSASRGRSSDAASRTGALAGGIAASVELFGAAG